MGFFLTFVILTIFLYVYIWIVSVTGEYFFYYVLKFILGLNIRNDILIYHEFYLSKRKYFMKVDCSII